MAQEKANSEVAGRARQWRIDRQFQDMPWDEIIAFLGSKAVRVGKDVEFAYKGRLFLLSDNGGEFNVFEVIRAHEGSIAYNGFAPQGPMSVACRIADAIAGKPVNYSEDVDAYTMGAALPRAEGA